MIVEGNLLADEEGKIGCIGLFPLYAAISNHCRCAAAVGGQCIAGEWEGSVFFVPLESADKTAIYNLIRLVSSTVNGRPPSFRRGCGYLAGFRLIGSAMESICVSSLRENLSSILLIDLAKRTD
jgi:hypothetical protein